MSGVTSKSTPNPLDTMTSSRIRRKPQFTYQSPLPGGPDVRIGPTMLVLKKDTSSHSSSTSSTTTILSYARRVPNTSEPATITRRTNLTIVPVRPRYFLEPALPLYHPLGKLALSLPELDPEKYGLPVPLRMRDREVKIDDDKVEVAVPATVSHGKRPTRSRRPAAKLRHGEGEDEGQSKEADGAEAESEESKIVNVEVKEKSPRKRRNGGGGGKRKRKEVDDGDATYPAKRTRLPRGASNTQAAASEDGSPNDATEAVADTPDSTMVVDAVREDSPKVPEKRATRAGRANGGVKRRDSTASADTSATRSGSIGSRGKGKESQETAKGSGSPSDHTLEEKLTKRPNTRRSRSNDNGGDIEEGKNS